MTNCVSGIKGVHLQVNLKENHASCSYNERAHTCEMCVFLQTLKSLCLDSKRSGILQRLELSLDILGGTVERISNTAEVLGAVHQVC